MKFSEAIKEFLAWKSFTVKTHTHTGMVSDLNLLCLYLHNPELETINWDSILQYDRDLAELGYNQNTIAAKHNAYRKFFEYWHRKNPLVLDHNWIPVGKKNYSKPRVMTEENFDKLIKTVKASKYGIASLRNELILRLLWDTGARLGEIGSLPLDVIMVDEQLAVIRTEKGRSRPYRQIFWTKDTNDTLKKYLKERAKFLEERPYCTPTALFFSLTGNDYGKPMQNNGISQMLRTLSQKAGIPMCNAHSFRHHMGHEIIKKGGTNSDVSNILGHANLASSYIYTQMSDTEIKERYQKFKGR